jgi:hypothetical protein
MKPPDQPPSTTEHAALVAYLQGLGLSAAQVLALIGTGPDGRSRRQLEAALTAWLRNRPKG